MSWAQLPVELIEQIAKNADNSALLALARASKQLNDISSPLLYHTISLRDIDQATHCFVTLAANAWVANSVRILIMCSCELRSEPKTQDAAFRDALCSAMHNLRSLEALNISRSIGLDSIICGIHFPRLRQCAMSYSQTALSFLSLHPDIEWLAVNCGPSRRPGDLHETRIDPSKLPSLRKLQYFQGLDEVAEMIIPNSCVSNLVIYWNLFRMEPMSELIDRIPKTKSHTLEIRNIVMEWNPELLVAISTGAARVTSLGVDNRNARCTPKDFNDFLPHIEAALSLLPSLTMLDFNQVAERPIQRDLDHEFLLVRQWSACAPSLRCCVFPSKTRWLRIGAENVWYPTSSSQELSGTSEFVGWHLKTIITSPGLPPEYMAWLEKLIGKEQIAQFISLKEEISLKEKLL